MSVIPQRGPLSGLGYIGLDARFVFAGRHGLRCASSVGLLFVLGVAGRGIPAHAHNRPMNYSRIVRGTGCDCGNCAFRSTTSWLGLPNCPKRIGPDVTYATVLHQGRIGVADVVSRFATIAARVSPLACVPRKR